MQEKAGEAWISADDAQRILEYLSFANIRPKQPKPLAPDAAAETVFLERCHACHDLERVRALAKQAGGDRQVWAHVVARMREKAPQWISEEEARKIAAYLGATTEVAETGSANGGNAAGNAAGTAAGTAAGD